MILSYDDEEYFSNPLSSQQKLDSEFNEKLKQIENEKKKQNQDNSLAYETKKQNINIFAASISEQNDSSCDDEILKTISEMKINKNQEKIANYKSKCPSQGEKLLSRDMLNLINSPNTVKKYLLKFYLFSLNQMFIFNHPYLII